MRIAWKSFNYTRPNLKDHLHNVDLKHLAKETEDYSGADIEGLVREAVSRSMARNCHDGKVISQEITVTMDDFQHALNSSKKSSDAFIKVTFPGCHPSLPKR